MDDFTAAIISLICFVLFIIAILIVIYIIYVPENLILAIFIPTPTTTPRIIPLPTTYTPPPLVSTFLEQNSNNGKWIIQQETTYLVFRDNSTSIDKRIAFPARITNTSGFIEFGNTNNSGIGSGVIKTFGDWTFSEFGGVLVIFNKPGYDDIGNTYVGGATYEFYPNSGVITFGNGTPIETSSYTITHGKQWYIRNDKGYLTFIDVISPGDNRYVFCPNSVINMNST